MASSKAGAGALGASFRGGRPRNMASSAASHWPATRAFTSALCAAMPRPMAARSAALKTLGLRIGVSFPAATTETTHSASMLSNVVMWGQA